MTVGTVQRSGARSRIKRGVPAGLHSFPRWEIHKNCEQIYTWVLVAELERNVPLITLPTWESIPAKCAFKNNLWGGPTSLIQAKKVHEAYE